MILTFSAARVIESAAMVMIVKCDDRPPGEGYRVSHVLGPCVSESPSGDGRYIDSIEYPQSLLVTAS